jgi:hypothetical protein
MTTKEYSLAALQAQRSSLLFGSITKFELSYSYPIATLGGPINMSSCQKSYHHSFPRKDGTAEKSHHR